MSEASTNPPRASVADDMRAIFRSSDRAADTAERRNALGAVVLPLAAPVREVRSRPKHRILISVVVALLAVAGVSLWLVRTAPARSLGITAAAIVPQRAPYRPAPPQLRRQTAIEPPTDAPADRSGEAGAIKPAKPAIASYFARVPAAAPARSAAMAVVRAPVANGPVEREGCSLPSRRNSDLCRWRALAAADLQLRVAYDEATAAGVSRPQLKAVRDRWEEVGDRFADDPEYQIANYRSLARSLNEMRGFER